MLTNVKIARTDYQRAPQNELSTFAAHVVSRMKGVKAYESLDSLVQSLDAASATYRAALTAARSRSTAEIHAKGLAKFNLLDLLNQLATALEALAGDDSQLIVETGFSLVQSSGLRYAGKLPAPVIRRASSTGRKGELRLNIANTFPQAVRMHAIELSYDRGQTWQNGNYNSHRVFTLTNIQFSSELWVRVAALGAGDSRSTWSEPVVTAVL